MYKYLYVCPYHGLRQFKNNTVTFKVKSRFIEYHIIQDGKYMTMDI